MVTVSDFDKMVEKRDELRNKELLDVFITGGKSKRFRGFLREVLLRRGGIYE